MIKGLIKEIIDPNTDATLNFHHIDNYTVDTRGNQSYLHIGSYVSEAAFNAGKQSVTTCSVSLSNIGSDNLLTIDWLYNGVILLEDSIFFNATKVE